MTTQLLQADVETLLGEYDTALDICRQVLDRSGTDESSTSAMASLQMGQIYVNQAAWDEAKVQYRRALYLFSELGDDARCARSYVGLGNMAFEQSDLDAAQTHFTDARETLSQSEDDGLLGVILGNLGVVATVRGQYFEAILHYTDALKAYLFPGEKSLRLLSDLPQPGHVSRQSG
jgi:tetratricopeptide (TPR) repeat protein